MSRKELNKPLFVYLIFVVLVLILYQTTTMSLYHLWIASDNVTYSHGSILLLISIYYIYRRWRALKSDISLRPSLFGLLLLFSTSLTWFLANIASIQVIQQLLFVLQFLFLLWALTGFQTTRKFAFPLLLLVCAVPIWEVINEDWLQRATAVGVGFMLELTGFVAHREGTLILVPAGTFQVAENCSGMRQLVVAIPIAFLYANLNQFRILSTLIYVFIAAVLSFLINTLRIYIVVVAGQLSGMQHYFIREDHVTLGWVLFGSAMFLFIYLSNRFLPSPIKNKSVVNISRKEKAFRNNYLQKMQQSSVFTFAFVFIALSSGPLLTYLKSIETMPHINGLALPSTINDWQLNPHLDDDYLPIFHSADFIAKGYYVNNKNLVIYSYIGFYLKQEQGKELISGLNRIYDQKNWHHVKTIQRNISVDNQRLDVNETILRSISGKEKLVWHWYYLAGSRTNKEGVAKLLGIWKELTKQQGSAVFIVANNITDSPEASREILLQYLKQSLVMLENTVNQAVIKKQIN